MPFKTLKQVRKNFFPANSAHPLFHCSTFDVRVLRLSFTFAFNVRSFKFLENFNVFFSFFQVWGWFFSGSKFWFFDPKNGLLDPKNLGKQSKQHRNPTKLDLFCSQRLGNRSGDRFFNRFGNRFECAEGAASFLTCLVF